MFVVIERPQPRTCLTCERRFRPEIRGYNARYCTSKCKHKARWHRKPKSVRKALRRKQWLATKADPKRYRRHKQRSKSSVRKIRVWLSGLKLKLGCRDCGYNKHAAALQFDHEGPKIAAISELRTSKSRILAEIKRGRCKVRCANCHSIKTWERKQK